MILKSWLATYHMKYRPLPTKLELEHTINAIARRLTMTIVEGPHVQDYDLGRVCYAIIAESHISIYVDKRRHMLWFDVTSCKEFDEGGLVSLLKTDFSDPIMAPWVCSRGIADASLPETPMSRPLHSP